MTIGELLDVYTKNITGSISIHMSERDIEIGPITIGLLDLNWKYFPVVTFWFEDDVLHIYSDGFICYEDTDSIMIKPRKE